jgi:hypothetical protein
MTMRATVLTLCFVLLLPAALPAQAPPVSYLGLYADEGRTGWCVSGTAPYPVDVWVYMKLGEIGAWGYSFDLEVPDNVEVLSMELNRYEGPILCLPPGCPDGIYGTFNLCFHPPRFDWIWIVHATVSVTDGNPSTIRIVPNPDDGTIRVENCDFEYENAPVLTNLYVNYPPSASECGSLPVQTSTWGAIKGMYETAP